MTKRTRSSWAAAAFAAAILCGCGGGSDGLAPGMPENIDMSKISQMPGGAPVKAIGKQPKAKKAD